MQRAGRGSVNNQYKKGVLELCVLALLAGKDQYGYDISEVLSRYIDISDGTVYPSISSAPENDDFDTYSILQYNNLFDKNRRDATLFDSASPTAVGKGIMITGLPLADTLTSTAVSTQNTGTSPALTGSVPSSVPFTVLTPTPAAATPAA